jgi:hypothetical protein
MKKTYCIMEKLIDDSQPFFIRKNNLFCEFSGVDTGLGGFVGNVEVVISPKIVIQKGDVLSIINLIQLKGISNSERYKIHMCGVPLFKDKKLSKPWFKEE